MKKSRYTEEQVAFALNQAEHWFRELPALGPRGLNVPALDFEVRVAYSSSIANPGLSAIDEGDGGVDPP